MARNNRKLSPIPAALPMENEARDEAMSDRIVSSARQCFERFGINKTTIDDIAKHASISRPTVYKYFRGKEDLLDRISHDESLKINVEVRKRLVRKGKFDEMMTEALLLVVRVAAQNPYVRRTLDQTFHTSTAASPDSAVHQVHRALWGRLLDQARKTGELASDLEIDEILSWLTLSELMLLIRTAAVELTDGELRHLIRRFVVAPLLARPAGR
jgi:AcrR family transcriptional regulator